MEAVNNRTIYQLQPKYMITNFNFDAMAATVTQSDSSFKNVGVFRTKTDLVGMYGLQKIRLVILIFVISQK